MMHGTQKSDSPIVAVKPANRPEHLVAGADAESVEPRGGAKGNADQSRTCRTRSRESVFQRLDRVRPAARQRKREKFTALMHLVDVELLRQSYFWLQKKAAAGVDGVTWQQYGEGLEDKLVQLHGRIHRNAYRATLWARAVPETPTHTSSAGRPVVPSGRRPGRLPGELETHMRTGLQLLLLDDDAVDADRVRAVLRDAGWIFEARHVDNAESLQRMLREWRPAALLAERRIAGLDGEAVLAIARRLLPRLPVLIVTAAAADETAVALLRAGAVGHLGKDRLHELPQALSRALDAADDARARAQAERALRLAELRLRRLFETARDAVVVVEAAGGTVVEANRVLVEHLGCRRDELVGHRIDELGPGKAAAVLAVVFRQLQQTDAVHYEHLTLQRAAGEAVEVEVHGSAYHLGSVRYLQCTMRDIGDQRRAEIGAQRARQELQAEMARHQQTREALAAARRRLDEESLRDSLTGLYNRAYLDQALTRGVALAHRNRWLFSVMLIEIDHFRETVARHGHAAGDVLLRAASTHLKGTFRESDTLCRHGDDSFVVLLQGTGPVAARDAAQRLRSRMQVLEMVLDGVALPPLTLSIGVAALTQAGQTVEQLMQAAERALQRVRLAGRDRAGLSSDYVSIDAMPE